MSAQTRGVIVTRFGGPEVLRLERLPEPAPPGPGALLVDVEATSASATDTVVRKGVYPLVQVRPPFTLGYELVGRVRAVGDDVTDVVVGQRVVAVLQTGANVTRLLVPRGLATVVPDDVPATTLLTFAVSGITAYQMLHRLAEVQPGATVLVSGASGAVGSQLVQLARHLGARVIGTASAAKLAFVEKLGAVAVDYQTPRLEDELRQLAPGGYDAAFDATRPSSFVRARRLLKAQGRLVTFGTQLVARGIHHRTPLSFLRFGLEFGVMQAQNARWRWARGHLAARFYGVIDHRRDRPDWYREDLGALVARFRQGVLSPQVDVLCIDDAAEAHRRVDAGAVCGQVVLTA